MSEPEEMTAAEHAERVRQRIDSPEEHWPNEARASLDALTTQIEELERERMDVTPESEMDVITALKIVREEVRKSDEGRGPDKPVERALLAHFDALTTQIEGLERAQGAVLRNYERIERHRDALNAENATLNKENRALLEKWSRRGGRPVAAEAQLAERDKRIEALEGALREIRALALGAAVGREAKAGGRIRKIAALAADPGWPDLPKER